MPFFDKQKLKIKMVVLTKKGNKNETFYSPVKHNNKPSELIINSMMNRLKKQPFFLVTHVIHFYENEELILKVKA
jgi:hypothetical protein